MTRRLLLASWLLWCVAGSSLFGQQPTVSGITITDLDTSSFRILYTVAGGGAAPWAEVFYGTSSGMYPYNTKSIKCYNDALSCPSAGGVTAFMVSGLAPGTTYYVRATARPNPNDDTNICNTNDCGAVEQVVTTLPGVSGALPVPPANWVPSLPDTTGYLVIPLVVGGTGECQSSATVTGPSWTVTSGMTLSTMLNSTVTTYGVVFEIPQGASCKVPPNASPLQSSAGYVLPSLALDNNCAGVCTVTDPRHRWIVFRTQQLQPTDFPPYGSRTGPDYAAKLGKFYSAKPNITSQLFDANHDNSPMIHHIWFQNVEFMDDPAYTNPVDYVDPPAFTFFAKLGSSFQGVNNQFLVLDRVYAHGPGAPIRHYNGYEISGNYMAMVGCYTSGVETWRMTLWPSNSGTLGAGNKVINIPQNTFRFSRTSRVLGMPGAATLTLNSAALSGTIVGNLYKDHLEIQYTAGAARLSCSGCVLTARAAPATPPTALQLFNVTFTSANGGQFSPAIDWHTQEFYTSIYPMSFGVQNGDLRAEGGPLYFENNYIDGVGEGYYVDAQFSAFSADDVTYTHNHHIWPKNYFALDPDNLWRYEVRQHWETKRNRRVLLKGNVFNWSWSYQNQGDSIFISGRTPYTIQAGVTGITDVKVESNIIGHGRSGVACQNGNPMDNNGIAVEPAAARRIQINNNLMYDVAGRWKYCDTVLCPAILSHYFQNRPGCQDLTITNNTMGPTYGDGPDVMDIGGGANLGNYLRFQNNVLYLSKGVAGVGGGNFGDWPANNVLNHDIRPSASYSNSGAAPNFKGNFDQSFVATGATVTPNYVWNGNVIIGGWQDTNGTLAGIVDISSSALATYAANMPSGDIYVTGETIAEREKGLHLPEPVTALGAGSTMHAQQALNASVANSGNKGVDYTKLTADQGLVTNIQAVQVSATAALFQYTAPDSRTCIVDVKPGNMPGNSWVTRTSDGGGARQRSVKMTGLNAGTIYQHRILCYYKQVNDGVLYLDYTADQITDGTFQTPASGTGSAVVPFTLGNIPNANKVLVTLTPVSGAAVTSTCTTSPCTLTVNSGDYALNVQYLSAANIALSSGSGHLKIP